MPSVPDSAPSAAAAKGGKRFGIGMLLGVALICTAGAGGVAYLMLGKPAAKNKAQAEATLGQGAEGEAHEGADHPPAPANYLGLEPAFVVNLESGDEPHYLQAEVQLMSRDAAALESVKVHIPLLRNTLLMLLGQQKPADLATRAGKEQLQQTALTEVQKVLEAETGKPVVEAVFFTSFVMQ